MSAFPVNRFPTRYFPTRLPSRAIRTTSGRGLDLHGTSLETEKRRFAVVTAFTTVASSIRRSSMRSRIPACSVGSSNSISSQQTQHSRGRRSEEHTSELQSPDHLVCRLLLEKKKYPCTN